MKKIFCDICGDQVTDGLSGSGTRGIGSHKRVVVIVEIDEAYSPHTEDVCAGCIADALRNVAGKIDPRRQEEPPR